MKKYKDYHKGLVAKYMDKIYLKTTTIGNVDTDELILDFGGGYGHLADYIIHDNIINYDIVPELSDIEDYTQLKPHTIIVCHVFEHMSKSEIEQTLINFKKMNPKQLIIALPTENIFSKIGVFITKLKSTYEDIPHLITYKEVNQLVEKHFELTKRKYIVFGMTQLSLYEIRRL